MITTTLTYAEVVGICAIPLLIAMPVIILDILLH